MKKNIIKTIKHNKIKIIIPTLTILSTVGIFLYTNIHAKELKIKNIKNEYYQSITDVQSKEAIKKNLIVVNEVMKNIQEIKSNENASIFLDELKINKNNYEANLLKIQRKEKDKLEKEKIEKQNLQKNEKEKLARKVIEKENKIKNSSISKNKEKIKNVSSNYNKRNNNFNKSKNITNTLTVDRKRGVYSDGYKTSKVDSGLFYIDCDRMRIRKFWVLEGKGDEQAQLKVAASLFTGSDRPSSNKNSSTNLVIGAHRTGGNGWNPFYNIHKLQNGDKIYMYLNGVKFTFEVFDQYVVHENSASKVARDFGYYVLTLFSCEGGNGTEYRRVVHAKLIG